MSPLEVLDATKMNALAEPQAALLRGWFEGTAVCERYGLNQHGRQVAVEMCHVLSNLGKTVALSAAESEDKTLQETLIKCAFHFNRLRGTWDSIAHALTGTHLDQLSPLTSTLVLNLALEELAKKDILAFSYAIDLFGPPGLPSSIEGVTAFFEGLVNEPAVAGFLADWKKESNENSRSYASVDTTKRYGYPLSGSYGKACAEHMGGILRRDLGSSLVHLIALGDQFHLFYRGARLFFVDKNAAFPRMQVNWLEV